AISRGRQFQLLQGRQRDRMHFTLGHAAGRIAAELAFAEVVEESFGDDGARRVTCAEKQDVVDSFSGHRKFLESAAGRPGLHGDAGRSVTYSGRRTTRTRSRSSRWFRALMKHRDIPQGVEMLPSHALWIGDPMLLAARVAAGRLAVVEQGHIGRLRTRLQRSEFFGGIGLNAEMVEARL